MLKRGAFLLFSFLSVQVFSMPAQSSDPQFPGGTQALHQFMQMNTHYPAMAKEAGIQGKVYVEFYVETDGRISDIVIIKGVHPDLDHEAHRVVSTMPAWIPATLYGVPTRAKVMLPFLFKLT